MGGGGGDAAVGCLALEEVGDGWDGVVAHVTGEFAHGACARLEFEAVVGIFAGPEGGIAAGEPDAPFGLPGVVEEFAGVEDLAIDGVSGVGRVRVDAQQLFDGGSEFGLQGFIGIEMQEPWACALFEGELFLFDIAEPRLMDDAGSRVVEQVEGGIGGARIDGDDLSGETTDGIEGAADGVGVVTADDGDGEFGHGVIMA